VLDGVRAAPIQVRRHKQIIGLIGGFFYPLWLTPALRQRPQVYIRSVWAQKHRTSGRQEGRCLLRCRRRKSDKIPKFDAEDAAGLPA